MSLPLSIWRSDTAPRTVKPGSYPLTVEQIAKIDKQYTDPTLKQTIHLEVRSDRFSPAEVRFRYPQDKAIGSFGDIVPHLVLSRGVMPWERTAYRENKSPDAHKGLPWLALLAVTEEQRQSVTLVSGTISELFSTDASPYLGIPKKADPWEPPTQPCRYLEMAHSIFLGLAPTATQLANLCHFQQEREGASGPLVSNAILLHHKPLKKSLKAATGGVKLFLVSLEGMAPLLPMARPPAPTEDQKKKVRLPVLGSWEVVVTTNSGHADFEGMAKKLKDNHGPLWYDEKKKAFAGYLTVPADSSCKEPCIYRGPLGLPIENVSVYHPIESAQKALRRVELSANGTAIDIGLAAAWELGKMIALNDEGLAQSLYEFRQEAIFERERGSHDKEHKSQRLVAPDLLVRRIFDLWLLKGVPLHYILPQPQAMPPESLRYAQLDNNWCGALIAGALSIGRHCKKHFEIDEELYSSLHTAIPRMLYGHAENVFAAVGQFYCFLLRSEIVPLWPDLEIDAWDFIIDPPGSKGDPKKVQRRVLRREKVAPDVLLVIVDERCSYLRFSLHGALLHFSIGSTYADAAVDSLFTNSNDCKGSTAHADRIRHARQEAVFTYRF